MHMVITVNWNIKFSILLFVRITNSQKQKKNREKTVNMQWGWDENVQSRIERNIQ